MPSGKRTGFSGDLGGPFALSDLMAFLKNPEKTRAPAMRRISFHTEGADDPHSDGNQCRPSNPGAWAHRCCLDHSAGRGNVRQGERCRPYFRVMLLGMAAAGGIGLMGGVRFWHRDPASVAAGESFCSQGRQYRGWRPPPDPGPSDPIPADGRRTGESALALLTRSCDKLLSGHEFRLGARRHSLPPSPALKKKCDWP